MSEYRILMSVNELRQQIGRADIAIVDTRFDLADPAAGRRSYREGHIPGAVFLDLDEDLAGAPGPQTGRHPLPDVAAISATLGRLGIGNDTTVVVYDAGNGAIAARAWWVLRWLGHEHTRLLDGGLAAWLGAGGALESGPASPETTTFRGDPQPNLILTTDELGADVDGIAERRLVDARDRARFRGEVEPIDPVAGHVPGAINLPFNELVTTEGLWLSPAARRSRLRTALGDDRTSAWAVMCGSGVTACHVAIAGLEAGYVEPRLYVGSWSEWIRDPGRPVSVGEG